MTASLEMGLSGEALQELRTHAMPLLNNCVSQDLLSPQNKPQCSFLATMSMGRCQFGFCPLEAQLGFSVLACSQTGYHCHQPIQLSQC